MAMLMLFTGALVIAGVFTFLPGRIMHSAAFGPDRAAALRIPQLERRHGSYRCCAAELSNHRSPYPAVAGERLEEFYALPMCY
jgi:hypothetical protein